MIITREYIRRNTKNGVKLISQTKNPFIGFQKALAENEYLALVYTNAGVTITKRIPSQIVYDGLMSELDDPSCILGFYAIKEYGYKPQYLVHEPESDDLNPDLTISRPVERLVFQAIELGVPVSFVLDGIVSKKDQFLVEQEMIDNAAQDV